MLRKGGKNSDLTLRSLDRGEELVVFLYRAAGLARFFNHDDKTPTMIARVMLICLYLSGFLTVTQRLTGGYRDDVGLR